MKRPLEFSQEIADEVCERLANGESMRAILRDEHMPASSSIYKWLRFVPDFAEQYARARQDQADTIADETVWIADTEEDPQRARVRIDARKWMAGKLRPKVYGDKVDVEHKGAINVLVAPEHDGI
jgi:hypothetical protein